MTYWLSCRRATRVRLQSQQVSTGLQSQLDAIFDADDAAEGAAQKLAAAAGKIDELQSRVHELEEANEVETVDLTGETADEGESGVVDEPPPTKRQKRDGDGSSAGGGGGAAADPSASSRLAGLQAAHAATKVKVEVARGDAAQEALRCTICWTNPRDVVFTACRHMVCCEGCIGDCLGLCPVCRQPIEGLISGVKMP